MIVYQKFDFIYQIVEISLISWSQGRWKWSTSDLYLFIAKKTTLIRHVRWSRDKSLAHWLVYLLHDTHLSQMKKKMWIDSIQTITIRFYHIQGNVVQFEEVKYAKDTKRYISRVTPLYITKYLLTRILHFWMHRMLEYSGFTFS